MAEVEDDIDEFLYGNAGATEVTQNNDVKEGILIFYLKKRRKSILMMILK